MKKCIHLRYDPDSDEFTLVGMDGKSMGCYTGDRPDDLLKILMAETIVQKECDEEVKLGMAGN